ncbi:MAG: ABC transporter permease [Ignavibacteria bacterium]|nr:ABC transporter permease [Ignavibacteria bacterium]
MARSIFVIVEIVKKEFFQIRQDKRMLAVSMVAPFLQVLLIGYAATTDIKNTDIVVCDLDKTSVSREFVSEFTNSGYFVQKYVVHSYKEVGKHIEQGKARMALVIPVSFGDDILARRTAQVQLILDGADANSASVLLSYGNQIATQYSQAMLAEVILTGDLVATGRILPEPRVWFNPDLLSQNFMVPGVVALVLMIITMTLTALGIVKEKELGTLEQLMVTPIKPFELIIGKLIPFIIIGFIDVIIVLAIAYFWFGVPLRGSLMLLFALSGLFILTTLGLGLFVSTIATSQQQAMLIAQFFFFMPFMFLSGFALPIRNMPELIQYVTYLIPLRYFLEIVRGLFLKGSGLSELWPQAIALLVFGVAILTMSVLRFHKKLE